MATITARKGVVASWTPEWDAYLANHFRGVAETRRAERGGSRQVTAIQRSAESLRGVPHLSGLAFRYGKPHARFLDDDGEPIIIAAGAFSESIASGFVDVRVSHGAQRIAGQADGSLWILDYPSHLGLIVHVANSHIRKRLAYAASEGRVNGWSISYAAGTAVKRDGVIVKARLLEISLCIDSVPRADGTTVSVKDALFEGLPDED